MMTCAQLQPLLPANVHFTLDDQPADGATTSNQSNLDVIDTIMAEDVEDEHKMKKASSTAVGKPVTTSNQQKTRSKEYIANKLGSESRNRTVGEGLVAEREGKYRKRKTSSIEADPIAGEAKQQKTGTSKKGGKKKDKPSWIWKKKASLLEKKECSLAAEVILDLGEDNSIESV